MASIQSVENCTSRPIRREYPTADIRSGFVDRRIRTALYYSVPKQLTFSPAKEA